MTWRDTRLPREQIEHVDIDTQTYEVLTRSEVIFVRNWGRIAPRVRKSICLKSSARVDRRPA